MKLAGVFPGQGAQSVGMMKELADNYPVVEQTFTEAADVLGYDLWSLVQQGPEEKLKITKYTQPAMFVSGVAAYRVWLEEEGPAPEIVAGHSLGEYSALVAAKVLSFADAMSIVALRGELMNSAVEEGAGGMAAILGLDDEVVVSLCQSLSGDRIVEAVNFNSPGQIVISGHVDALEKAVSEAKKQGAKMATMLPVSVPNHSSLMSCVADPLAQKINSVAVSDPIIPVVQNFEGKIYDTLDDMLGALRRHVDGPVYWTATVHEMKARGVDTIVEFGPGKVLSGLVKRIDRRLGALPVFDMNSLQKALSACRGEK